MSDFMVVAAGHDQMPLVKHQRFGRPLVGQARDAGRTRRRNIENLDPIVSLDNEAFAPFQVTNTDCQTISSSIKR
jgi:hypothetical protein